MSAKSNPSKSQPASNHGPPSDPDRVFVLELEGEQYRVEANSRQSAKYAAANKRKEQAAGPAIGRGVDELAGIATIIGSLRK